MTPKPKTKRKSPNVLYLGDLIQPWGYTKPLEVIGFSAERVMAKRPDYTVPHLLSYRRATS